LAEKFTGSSRGTAKRACISLCEHAIREDLVAVIDLLGAMRFYMNLPLLVVKG
jgi:hypothetical protein